MTHMMSAPVAAPPDVVPIATRQRTCLVSGLEAPSPFRRGLPRAEVLHLVGGQPFVLRNRPGGAAQKPDDQRDLLS